MRNRRRRGRAVILVLLAGLGAALLLGASATRAVRDDAARGRSHLLRAQDLMVQEQYDEADRELAAARASFARVRADVDRLGPVAIVSRLTPVLRVQVRAAERFADAGDGLAEAAQQVTAAARAAEAGAERPLGGETLDLARQVEAALRRASARVDTVASKVAELNGLRLLGPLDEARAQFAEELPAAQRRLRDGADDVAAAIAFAGGSGPRRYLVLTQNPDESRPTGGFVGSYGVLAAEDGRLRLESYQAIELWLDAHPDAITDLDSLPTPFKLVRSGILAQNLANANTQPDWSDAAAVAMSLWEKGGEAPVDGVLSLTPELLARIVGVLGPVRVESYGETVTADNLIEKVDFYSHDDPLKGSRPEGRKGFLIALARSTMTRVTEASLGQVRDLADPLAAGMSVREGMAWTRSELVQSALERHRWAGALPTGSGDYMADPEFAYATKESRELVRSYSHSVRLRADGSGEVSTVAHVENPSVPDADETRTGAAFTSFYGPRGARAAQMPRTPTAEVSTLRGHPGVAFLVTTPPSGGTSDTTVAWDAPALAKKVEGGRLQYSLRWIWQVGRLPATVSLDVKPPPGWRWVGDAPPAQLTLDGDLRGTWLLERTQ